ncbi:hypothetical protein ACNE9Y_23960 [Pseudomonas sp. NY11226]|uniref:hypothetical protein n=1 Tax=Pseudomonas sp. NY11226 TaxID=3400362 RepID=UPI003A85914F
MQKSFIINLKHKNKWFSFYSPSGHFNHNENYIATRWAVLNHLGNTLKSSLYLLGSSKFSKDMEKRLSELFNTIAVHRIGPNEPDRKWFINHYEKVINKLIPLILTNQYESAEPSASADDDFDFTELDKLENTNVKTPDNLDNVFSGDFNFDGDNSFDNEDIPLLKDFVTKEEAPKTTSKIHNVDDFDFDELELTDTKETIAQVELSNTDDFNFDELDVNTASVDASNETVTTDDFDTSSDFDFVDDVLSKDLNNGKVSVAVEHLDDDFDFEETDAKPAPTESSKENVNAYTFDFSEFDEAPATSVISDEEAFKVDDFDFTELDTPTETRKEPAKKRPSFYFKNSEFSLFISYNTMSFKASGHDSYTVNALNRFATLLFVNQELITSVSHPEWLYSGLENGLDAIFDKITSIFKFKTKDEIALTEQYMFTQLYVVLWEYKDLVGYYTKHKDPFDLKHN